jgi:hypothetical protein
MITCLRHFVYKIFFSTDRLLLTENHIWPITELAPQKLNRKYYKSSKNIISAMSRRDKLSVETKQRNHQVPSGT